ncbi:prolyl aminopeptidase [Sandaracinobacteroides saxicola]|uniref:Proline iminopeptidase n=1 Tax=Sandaracinobacteroides saxicola TaxID=2759707 RepID=A0A7G5IK95_9SPHN|nr:prolyl aminopeptidase [Sandaracinobacteroides saxicola]QMW23787.1 prolyl aminopeptidase [Sandaracinobacteroides saxicola]
MHDFLFPEIEPHASGHFAPDDVHTVYWEECGNPDGVPLLFLHGGPGGPSMPAHRRYFDPGFYRFITFHQRGCGKSVPPAETRGNSTQALIADIERLRNARGIARWLVVGGSWGTALGIAYGEAHPQACFGFGLMGVTLGRPTDRDWWWRGTRKLFPEPFDEMLQILPEASRDEPMKAMHRLLIDPDPAVHLPAARALCLFSAATVSLEPNPEALARYEDPEITLPLARLFLHYCVNDHFFVAGQLLRDLGRVAHLPCAIVAARHDVTTPPEAAWTLHKAWPGSTYTVVRDGAHGLSDPQVARAFLDCIEQLKEIAR